MRTRTKIICTIGPSVRSLNKILELIDTGMNAARLNFSHGSHEEHAEVIALVKKARKMRGVPVSIMLDTKGPEIRLGRIKNDSMPVSQGQRLKLVKTTTLGDAEKVSVHPAEVLGAFTVGATVLIDDGYIIAKVVAKNKQGIEIEIGNNGVLKSGKKLNAPDVDVSLPAMTEEDIADIRFGCQQGVDIIAASFIRSAEHLLEIKRLLTKLKKPEILVYAKIENSLGVKNFEEIVKVSDGIMVARGDLGVELPLPRVPILQKMMIRKSYEACKPVVTATQMLESMITNPRPTRAEVSDVANAIYDSSSSIMLSGETAVGKYPTETVAMMKEIALQTEQDFNYREFFHRESHRDNPDVSLSVAMASIKTAYSTSAKAIFAMTSSGVTARQLSRFRPEMPILVYTKDEKTYHQLALNWGVIAIPPQPAKNADAVIKIITAYALKHKIVKKGDLVVITMGTTFGVTGSTDMMMVQKI